MTTISREKAREIVDGIRENNGGISEADRDKTPASVLRSLDSVRKKLGRATQTYEDHHKVFPNIRTSMTLTLTNPSEAEKLATEFYDLPETLLLLLLFLDKLKRITILKAEPPYKPSEVTYSKQEDPM